MCIRDRQAPTSDAELVVPLTAVVDRGDGPAVWVVADDKAQRRPVEIRRYREDGAVLAGGVQAGEQVVTVGAHKLVADQPVSYTHLDVYKRQCGA